MPRLNRTTRCGRLLGRRHGDPYLDALAGVVRHASGVLAAIVFVGHAIAFDALFVLALIAHAAAAHDFFARIRAVLAPGAVMTDTRADQCARDRGGIVAAAAADLVTDDAADDAAEDRAARNLRRMGVDITDVVVALAPRRLDAHLTHDRLDARDGRIVIIVRTIVAGIRPGRRRRQRDTRHTEHTDDHQQGANLTHLCLQNPAGCTPSLGDTVGGTA